MSKSDKLRYPIGKFVYGKSYTPKATRKNIKIIAKLPKELKKLLKRMSGNALDTPYRSGGWTVRQVVHHLADSHMNAYIRMKLTVTEPTPVIKPYEEGLWAEITDGKEGSAKLSLRLLGALHRRWTIFLENLTEDDLERGYFHPDRNSVILLPEAIALYAWHSKHHLAHIALVADAKTKTHNDAAPALLRSGQKPAQSAPKAADKEKPGVKKRNQAAKAKSAKKETAGGGPKLTRAEILAKARAARAAKAATSGASTAKSKPAKAAPKAKPAKKKAEGPKLTRAEILAKARAARAAKAAPKAKPAKKAADGPKLTRAEILAKARAARAANAAPKAKPAKKKADGPKLSRAEILAKARAARAAKAAPKAKPAKKAADGPKLSRAEILAKARAAKAANAAPKAKPAKKAADGPKLTRAEILAKARAAKAANAAPKAKPAKKKADGPKLTRAEILAKARAAKVTKKG